MTQKTKELPPIPERYLQMSEPDLVRVYFPMLDNEQCMRVLWSCTGFPYFIPFNDGEHPIEGLERQLKKLREEVPEPEGGWDAWSPEEITDGLIGYADAQMDAAMQQARARERLEELEVAARRRRSSVAFVRGGFRDVQ